MAEKSDEFKEVKKLIASIQKRVEGGEYVYRGTPEIHRWNKKVAIEADEKRINSSIFRQYDKNIDFGKYQPANDENRIIKDLRSYFSPHTSNIEILSDLRHFGGDTTLIDFSRDLFVALFFACNGELDKDGELIAFPIAKTKTPSDDYFYGKSNEEEQIPKEISLINPVQTQTNKARVIAQKSVFIHAPEGFISPDSCTIISIKSEIKKQILDYIKRFHDIDERTIYPDLHGFIASQKRFVLLRKYFYAGNALREQRNYEEAVKEYDEAIRIKPDFVDAYLNRGLTKEQSGDLDEAIADYNEAIRLKPDFAEAYYNRGYTKVRNNKREEAIADYDKAIYIKPDFVDAYSNRGVTKIEIGKLEEAIADFDKSIHLKPDLADVYTNRGFAKMELGELEEAIADVDEAIRLKPDFAEAYSMRGAMKDRSDKPKEAIADYDKAIRLKPDYASAYFNRGGTWQMLGEHEKAQADYAKAKELGFKFPDMWHDSDED